MKTHYSCIACIACIFCIVCILSCVLSQVADDFSDGNFNRNPRWAGDTLQFEVNQAGQLHLKSQGSDTSVLLTESDDFPNTEWRFWIKLSFNTSSNNYARIYLASDTLDVLSPMNGYFLQAGGADDSIFIMKQQGTMHSTNTLRFKITRDEAGNWEAMVDTAGGFNYCRDGRFTDHTFMPARWFGVFCRYTSSNAAKFYFDDFYAGPVIHDTISPSIISAEVPSEKVINVAFTETVDRVSAETTANYVLSPGGKSPDSARMEAQRPVVDLFLHDSMTEGAYGSLSVKNIADATGNRMRDTVVPVCYYRPKAFDVLINEIMADPDPPVSLPEGEYVELFNRTSYPLNLKGWSFSYGSYAKVFTSLVIPPKGYLLVVKDSAFLNYAGCAVLFTSSTSLSNEGTVLVLKDPQHHVIHTVSYSPEWFKGSFKADGGWSLEMADPLNPCGCGENWGPSMSASGGTPGMPNSTGRSNPDEVTPVPVRALITDSTSLEVYFSENMDSASLLSPAGWVAYHPDGVMHPDRVQQVPPEFKSVKLLFSKAFERSTPYTLRVTGDFKDCSGNLCDTARPVRFAFPDTVTIHDVVINEILSNPASGGARFAELYNRSEKIIDLQTLTISNRDTAMGIIEGATPLFSSGYLMFPGDYIALTSNPEDIRDRYHVPDPAALVSVPGFPVFGDDSGTVILAKKDNNMIIDRLRYDPGMQYPLLVTSEGVSLERTSPEMPSGERDNWHSAAETVGFATPGYLNSHAIKPETSDQAITVNPVIFSPDNDGRDDLLSITVHENDPDYSVSIEIYDSRGGLVNHLVNNVLPGSEGIFIWDGMTDDRSKAPMGFYILLVELTRPDGMVRRYKKVVVLGGKL